MRASLLERISRVFHHGAPSAEAVLVAAGRFGCPVNLSYVDKERILRNLGCLVSSIRKNRVTLKLDEAQPGDYFNHEKCYIYFKLPETALEKLRLAKEPAYKGFLCKSSILDCKTGDDGLARKLEISLPRDYIRRELRSHERYRIFSGMMADAALWILSGKDGHIMSRKPDFSCHPDGQGPSLRIINISTGGARVIIDKTDYLEELASAGQKTFLLRLGLNIVPGEVLDTFIVCGCVGSNYCIGQRRFTLRLRFLHNRNPNEMQDGQINAINDIDNWLGKRFG